MRKFKNNEDGVANIIGYLFSLAVASMVMVSSVIITNNIIDQKKSQVAEIEAQRIANYVANAITDAVAAKQSMPEADYHRTLALPATIGGMSYGIEVTDTTVSVVSSAGRVLATSSTYNADELGVNIVDNIVYGSDIEISSEGGQFVRKYDFGTGNSYDHSPVEAGSFRVDKYNLGDNTIIGQPKWQDEGSPNRIPIVVKNPSDYNFNGSAVKIVLNTSNFDYDNVTVVPQSKTQDFSGSETPDGSSKESTSDLISADQFRSDMKIYECEEVTGGGTHTDALDATIAPPSSWYKHWELGIEEDVYVSGGVKIRDRDNISFTITGISGADISRVIWNSITLGPDMDGAGYVKCYKYESSTGKAYFDCSDVFQVFFPSGIGGNCWSVFNLSGYVVLANNSVKMFKNTSQVEIKLGDFYVDNMYGLDTNPGTEDQPFSTIQHAIQMAGSGKTIFIRDTGVPYLQGSNSNILVNKKVTLVGEYSSKTDLEPSVVIRGDLKSDYIIKINSGGSGARLIFLDFVLGGYTSGGPPQQNCDGIVLENCNNVVISNCHSSQNRGDGIRITDSSKNIITHCKSHDNIGFAVPIDEGEGLEMSGIGSERNCIMHSKFCGQSGYDGDGIVLKCGANNNTILYCEVYGNNNDQGDGIELVSSTEVCSYGETSDNEIVDCVIRDNNGIGSDGIQIMGYEGTGGFCYGCFGVPKRNNITRCEIYNNGNLNSEWGGGGIYIYWSPNNNITDCKIYNNNGCGIWVYKTWYNTIANCNIYDNYAASHDDTGDGIRLSYICENNRITNCDVHGNEDDGIELQEAQIRHKPNEFSTRSNTIEKCRIHDNDQAGIFFFNTILNTIKQCDIYLNVLDGIHLDSGDVLLGEWSDDPGNLITYCNIFANGEDGMHLWGGLWGFLYNTKIIHNNFYDNGIGVGRQGAGIYLGSDITHTLPIGSWIYLNNFLNKTSGDYCAYDSSGVLSFNYWNSRQNINGNYWCDLNTYAYPGKARYIQPNTRDVCIDLPIYYRWAGEDGRYKIDPRGGPNSCGDWSNGWDDDNPRGPGHPTPANRTPFLNPSTVIVEPTAPPWASSSSFIITNGSVYPFDGIQIAIDKVNDGGTVYIMGSSVSYAILQPIIISKSLRLIGIPNAAGVYPTIQFSYTANPSDKTILKITGLSSSVDTSVAKQTVFIENITFDGKIPVYNNYLACRGIGIDFSVHPVMTDDYVSISNCVIKNVEQTDTGLNGEAIYINEKQVSVKNCSLQDNKYGIYYQSGSQGKIIGCSFDGNQEYGVYVTSSPSDNMIYHNYFGPSNTKDAKNLGSNNQWDNGYPSGGNRWTKFDDATENAKDVYHGVTIPPTLIGGDGIVDSSYSIEGGGQDRFPLGGTVAGQAGLPPQYVSKKKLFMIDYWNPYGESVLLVNLSIPAGAEERLFLYYGGGNVETDSIGNVAEFYDTFDSTLSSAKWNVLGGSPAPEISSDGVLNLRKIPSGGKAPAPTVNHIISKWPIPLVVSPDDPTQQYVHVANESLYLVEASIKLNDSYDKNQANLILLSQANNNYQKAYLTTLNFNPSDTQQPNKMLMHKRISDTSDPPIQQEIYLNSSGLPNLSGDWVRMKSYVYISKNKYALAGSPPTIVGTEIAEVNNTLFDLASYSNFNRSSYMDGYNIDASHNPTQLPGDSIQDGLYDKGYIGIGCGLLEKNPSLVLDRGSVLVDWIRVIKTSLVPPKITIGAAEGNRYYWHTGPVTASDANPSGNPSSPGPLLRDYHYYLYSPTVSGDKTFVIKGVEGNSKGIDYRISITKGSESESLPSMNVEILGDPVVTFPTFRITSAKQYETESVTITKTDNSDINIKFSKITGGAMSGIAWAVNSIVIERVENGIMIK